MFLKLKEPCLNIIRKLTVSSNWNIGFVQDSIDSIMSQKHISSVKWMKHFFKDRFFADPFILSLDEEYIYILAEECNFKDPKGIIVELVVDRKTFTLVNRTVLLDVQTHLSYPAIFRECDTVWVYPENGQSGVQNIYKYDYASRTLFDKNEMLSEPLADSTIFKHNGKYYLFATKYPNTQSDTYIYVSDKLESGYDLFCQSPIDNRKNVTRSAGDFFIHEEKIIRPVQNCTKRYGQAIVFKLVNLSGGLYCEEELFELHPIAGRYGRGLHTINIYGDIIVIDGYGYLYPIIGPLLFFMKNSIKYILNIFKM